MDQPVERRVSFRLPFVSKVICFVNETETNFFGTLRDMSISSLFMETDNYPDIGDTCNIDIVFEGESSRLKIENVKGSIVRSDEDGVAIRFDDRLEWFALVPLYFHKLRE